MSWRPDVGEPAVSPEPDRTDTWLAFGVVLVAVAVQWPIHDRWLALLDEGYILSIADDVNRGKVLYRDVTVDAPLPAAFHLLAAWFRLVGASVANSRLLAVGGFAAYVGLLFRISREFLPRGRALALVAVLLCYRIWAFPHWHVFSYSLTAATLLTAATTFVFAALRRRSSSPLVFAGLFAGAAIVSKQDYGVGVTGALGLALLILPWLESQRPAWLASLRGACVFALAALAVVLPTLAYFAWNGAWDALVEQTLYFPLSAMEKASYTRLPALWPLFGQDAALREEIGSYFPSILATLWWYPCEGCWVSDMSRGPLYHQTAFWDVLLKLIYWAPITITAAAALAWLPGVLVRGYRRAPVGKDARRLVLLALAFGFLLAFNPPRDWVHLMMVYPPSLVVGAVLLQGGVQRLSNGLRRLAEGAVLGVIVAVGLVSLALMDDLRRTIDWPLETPRGGVYADAANGPIIEDVLAYLEREVESGQPVPVYPIQPMIGFLAGRESAGGYHVIWPLQAGKRDASIIADLEERDVSHVVYSLSQYAHLRPFSENAPHLYEYLVRNYEIDRVFTRVALGPLVVALRRRAPSDDRLVEEGEVGAGAQWESWPFARVLTHAIGSPTSPIEHTLTLEVSRERPVFETAAGVDPHRWLTAAGGPLVFRAFVRDPDGAAVVPAARVEIDPHRRVEDRRWHPMTLDLGAYVGKTVDVVLSIESTQPARAAAGWREPRLSRASATSAPTL